VKNYVFRLFEKLGVSTRIELALSVRSQEKPAKSAEDTAAGRGERSRTKLRAG
jgi:hypothetical protein